jgi:hypothetical protein
MKIIILFINTLLFASIGFSQSTTTNLILNKNLIPQEIQYDGKPELEYIMNNKTIALDSYIETDYEGKYIRMKLNNKEVILKMQENNTSKLKRIYSDNEYNVTFYDVVFGACAGEGTQNITGKLLIKSNTEYNNVNFKGRDALYSSKKCQAVGNDW